MENPNPRPPEAPSRRTNMFYAGVIFVSLLTMGCAAKAKNVISQTPTVPPSNPLTSYTQKTPCPESDPEKLPSAFETELIDILKNKRGLDFFESLYAFYVRLSEENDSLAYVVSQVWDHDDIADHARATLDHEVVRIFNNKDLNARERKHKWEAFKRRFERSLRPALNWNNPSYEAYKQRIEEALNLNPNEIDGRMQVLDLPNGDKVVEWAGQRIHQINGKFYEIPVQKEEEQDDPDLVFPQKTN